MERGICTDLGAVYFLRERDRLTNDVTPYVSILLGSDDFFSADTRDILGTGNPRQFYVEYIIDTPCAEAIATILRYEYIDQAVMPDWFYFGETSSVTVRDLYARANQLAEDFRVYSSVIEMATDLAKLPSGSNQVLASVDAAKWWTHFLVYDKVSKVLSTVTQEHLKDSGKIQQQREPYETLRGLLKSLEIEQRKRKFQTAYPQIYGSFIRRMVTASHFATFGELPIDEPAGIELIQRARHLLREHFEVIEVDDTKGDVADAILLNQFRLNQMSNFSKVQREIARCHLQVECGTSRGIFGICAWERLADEVLDVEALKQAHPELWAECGEVTYYSERETLEPERTTSIAPNSLSENSPSIDDRQLLPSSDENRTSAKVRP